VEERRGHPACRKGTGGEEEGGILHIDFPNPPLSAFTDH
jgi:hypothetical protein